MCSETSRRNQKEGSKVTPLAVIQTKLRTKCCVDAHDPGSEAHMSHKLQMHGPCMNALLCMCRIAAARSAELLRLGLLMALTMTLHNMPEGFAVRISQDCNQVSTIMDVLMQGSSHRGACSIFLWPGICVLAWKALFGKDDGSSMARCSRLGNAAVAQGNHQGTLKRWAISVAHGRAWSVTDVVIAFLLVLLAELS